MNTKLLGLLAAASIFTAACSQEKPVETTTTVPVDANTAVVIPADEAYRTDADALADRVAADLKMTDTVVVNRIRNVYYTRGRKMNAFVTDTTGRYAATRAANDEANREVKAILTNPADYNTYSSNMGTYYAGQPYTVVVVNPTPAAKPSLTDRVSQGTQVTKLEREKDGDKKTKFENGAKIKRDDDGSIKIKQADGTKIKIDENGKRTVK